MKNILKIMLMMITIFTIAGSAVYAAEIPVSDQDQLITSRDWTEISNLQDEMKKEEPDATIDYDKALKVYVDCNLIKLQTADTKKLTSALESANYVWVIPFKMEKTYGMFTVAKGLPLSEEAKSVLTKAEQEEVKNHAGKWMITETAEHTVEPYYDILLEKREALSDCTRVVLVGSQPGMRQPVALGMDDETARIWISLGYQYPVMEKIPETQNVESGVYSFDSVAEISDTYIEDSEVSTGAGVQSRSSMKYVAGIGIIVIGSILILSVLKKKKLETVGGELAKPGDAIIVTGDIGRHGCTILLEREDFGIDADVTSDCAPLWKTVKAVMDTTHNLHVIRDATRGGVGTVLYEIAGQSSVGIRLNAEAVPVRPEVKGVCGMLGLEPLYLACEGRLVIMAPKEEAEGIVETLKKCPYSTDAAIIGEVIAEESGRVIMETEIGTQALLPQPGGELLPRIC